jgi:hypothetical protein
MLCQDQNSTLIIRICRSQYLCQGDIAKIAAKIGLIHWSRVGELKSKDLITGMQVRLYLHQDRGLYETLIFANMFLHFRCPILLQHAGAPVFSPKSGPFEM